MKQTRKILLVLLAFLTACTAILTCGCSKSDAESVVIWTSGEDYRNEYYLSELQKKFPDYDISLEYMNTSTIAAKVIEEGESCECDIILSEEYGYLTKCEPYLAELKDFDFSAYLPEVVPASHKFTPEYKNGGCVILNTKVLKDKNLPEPTSYDDLLDPAFKGLISMPSPASSGTGYMFLRQLTNEWGEDRAFEYFAKLTDNILAYTSSGSGPVNALVQGEVAVGLGMTMQAATEISQGVELKIVFFEEGSPHSLYGNSVLSDSAERPEVMEVFNYLSTELCRGNNEKFCPEQVFKDLKPTMEGFPTEIPAGNMANDTQEEKERLLKKWTFS